MIDEILEYFGGPYKLSKALKVKPPAVSQWFHNGIPAARAVQIEVLTGGKFKAVDILRECGYRDDG